MRIGSLVFATDQGLGVLAKAFYDHGVVTDVMTVAHGRRQEHPEWYPGARRLNSIRADSDIMAAMDFCTKMDAMLFFETPFIWPLLSFCHEHGIKTALMPMHECYPKEPQALPDLFLCPSLIEFGAFERDRESPLLMDRTGVIVCGIGKSKACFLPVPVEVPWRQRTRAKVFVHNAGWGGLKGRNGTAEVIEGWKHVKSPVDLIVRMQEPGHDLARRNAAGGRLRIIHGNRPWAEVWKNGGEGDVFLFPEKFNGLSLPLQEARAAGMLVMATDRFPMNTWLPTTEGLLCPLVPVKELRRASINPRFAEFDEAVVDPKDIAAKIDEWFGRDISAYSQDGKAWAETMSWEALKPRYLEVLTR